MERLTSDLLISILLHVDYEQVLRLPVISKKFHDILAGQEYWILRALKRLGLPESSDFRLFFNSACRDISDKLISKSILDVIRAIDSKAFDESCPKNLIEENSQIILLPEINPIRRYLRALAYGEKVERNSTEILPFELFIFYLIRERKLEEFREVLQKHFITLTPGFLVSFQQYVFILLIYCFRKKIYDFLLITFEYIGSDVSLDLPAIYRLPEDIQVKIIEICQRRSLLSPSEIYSYRKYKKEGTKILSRLSSAQYELFISCLESDEDIEMITRLPGDIQYRMVRKYALRMGRYVGPYSHEIPMSGSLSGFEKNNTLCSCFEHHPELVPLALKISENPIQDDIFSHKYVWITQALEYEKEIKESNSEIILLKNNPELRKIVLSLFPFPPTKVETFPEFPIYFTETTWSFSP